MEIERTTIDGVRHYTDGDESIMSVTTVLKELEEDTTGLETWKSQNDGSGDNAHHEHLYWYSGPRGTLCHYDALSAFEQYFPFEADMWGDEEADSETAMERGQPLETGDDGPFDDASYDESDIVYSLLKDRGMVENREQYDAFFDDITLERISEMDRTWFAETFDDIAADLGIDSDSVIAVEVYVFVPELYVAGQADLIYENPDGEIVLADLKTSSSLRQKHRLQTVAYAMAVDATDDLPDIDRIEVIRASPTNEDYEVYTPSSIPPHAEDLPYYTDENWFVDPWGEFEYDDTEDMWETFTELTVEARRGDDDD